MKTKLILAMALGASACVGFLVGRIHRPLNLTIMVTGDIKDHDGMGISGITAALNDVEVIALQSKPKYQPRISDPIWIAHDFLVLLRQAGASNVCLRYSMDLKTNYFPSWIAYATNLSANAIKP